VHGGGGDHGGALLRLTGKSLQKAGTIKTKGGPAGIRTSEP
jgi:hypothetical protein